MHLPSRDREKLRKNASASGRGSLVDCPTNENTGLALVAQAVSPATFDFFSASGQAVFCTEK
jgi:hypothetical protein